MAADAADFKEKGGGSAAGCVEGLHRFAQGATAPAALRVMVAPYRAQIIKTLPPIPVISTETKRSGEISLSDGTGGIDAGDLSTQSIIRAVLVCLP